MKNPWEEIDLSVYEKHMSLDSIFQLQALNEMMKSQFYTYPAKSIMILGIAGGNGLEHIDTDVLTKVYGVDINEKYLSTCINRYPELQGILNVIQADLTQDVKKLPYADLLIANLFIEYVGYECFKRTLEQVKPKYISCIIQKNNDISFVSASPYVHAFDRLDEIHHQIEEGDLLYSLDQVGYKKITQVEKELTNGKRLVRMDFGF